MLNKVLDVSLRNRMIILLLGIVLSASGFFVVRSMDVDVFPDLTAPTVIVMTEAHGLEAEEVERLITYEIEMEMNGAPNVRRVRSNSSMGISTVWVEFKWGTDIYKARQIVNERLDIAKEQLPDEVEEPTLAPITSIMGEVMLVGISSDTTSPMRLRTLVDWEIIPRIKAVDGVAKAIPIGGVLKQYQILASPEKMHFYGVSLDDIEKAAEESNHTVSGGFYNSNGNQFIIKGEGRIYSKKDLTSALIKKRNGMPVTIGEVADVVIAGPDKIGDGSVNGEDAIVLTIAKQPETNTLELDEKLDEVFADLEKSLPEDVKLRTHIFRQSDFIEGSISNLQQTLVEGAIFVVLILFLFLLNWRTTLISLVAIPVSLLASFLVLKLLGYSINTMSLGGMAIAIGVLVDDAIIDVENVYKRLRENIRSPREKRKNSLLVILEASMEIRSSIIIATFIIIVAFVPLFFLSGMEGRLLKPLGIAFIVSVLASLVTAVTITPVLCSYLLDRKKLLEKRTDKTRVERFFAGIYRSVLLFVIRMPRLVIVLTLLLLAFSVYQAFFLGRSFLPSFNEGSLVINVNGPPSMSLDESNKVGRRVENVLLEFPEIDVIARRTGRSEMDEHGLRANNSEVDAPFHLGERSKEEFLQAVREELGKVKGVNVSIGMPIVHRIDHMLSGTQANIAIKLFGTDLSRMYSIGKQIESTIGDVPGLVDVNVEQQVEVPQVRITPRRHLLNQYGLTVDDLNHFIETAYAGKVVSQVYEGNRSFDMIVRYNQEHRGNVEKIKKGHINIPGGGQVELGRVADVRSVSTPYAISREQAKRKLVISANVADRDLRGVVNDVRSRIDDNIDLPTGYHIEYGGQFESEEKASQMLMITSIAAVIIILILLFYEFSNWKLAGIVLINLPLALIGGVLIVRFSTGVVSIASTIGFISLFGIAARNGILLVSRFQALREEGLSTRELIVRGALDRLNPILMTALTTALALIPLALKADQPGSEIQSPMAVVILGGLLSATLLNLVVIPCVYLLVEGRRKE